jgi:hypothetical protein
MGARARGCDSGADEAGQAALAWALAAARAAWNIVVVGDPQQIEHPNKGAHLDGADPRNTGLASTRCSIGNFGMHFGDRS